MKQTLLAEKGLGSVHRRSEKYPRGYYKNRGDVCTDDKSGNHAPPKEKEICEEGCLSLPKQYRYISRALAITGGFVDIKGGEHILHLEKLSARVMQHEVDHLDGVLISDY